MRVERAKEILNATNTIEVTYQGTPIWITNVNNSNQTAEVKMPKNSETVVEVPVTELIEH